MHIYVTCQRDAHAKYFDDVGPYVVSRSIAFKQLIFARTHVVQKQNVRGRMLQRAGDENVGKLRSNAVCSTQHIGFGATV